MRQNFIVMSTIAGIILFFLSTQMVSAAVFTSNPDLSSLPSTQIDTSTGLYLWSTVGDTSFQNSTMFINSGISDSYSQQNGFIFSYLAFNTSNTDGINVEKASADIKLLSNLPELLNSEIGVNITKITDQGDQIQIRVVLSNFNGEQNGSATASIHNHNKVTDNITTIAYKTIATGLDLTKYHCLSVKVENDTAYLNLNSTQIQLPVDFSGYGTVVSSDAYVWQWTYDLTGSMKAEVKNVQVDYDYAGSDSSTSISDISSTTNPFDTGSDTTDSGTTTTWYLDSDGDGFGDPDNSTDNNTNPFLYVADNNF